MSDDTSSHVRVSHLYDELLLGGGDTPNFGHVFPNRTHFRVPFSELRG